MVKNKEKQRRMQLRRDIGNREPPEPWTRVRGPERLVAHACFACRRSFKAKECESMERPCPECGEPAFEMGRTFKTPARSEAKQWLKVQTLFAHGFRFFSYGSQEYEPLPGKLWEVDGFIARNPDHPLRVAEPCPDLLPAKRDAT